MRDPVSKARDSTQSDGNHPSPVIGDFVSGNSLGAGTGAGRLALVVAGRKGKVGDRSVGMTGERRTVTGGGLGSPCSSI